MTNTVGSLHPWGLSPKALGRCFKLDRSELCTHHVCKDISMINFYFFKLLLLFYLRMYFAVPLWNIQLGSLIILTLWGHREIKQELFTQRLCGISTVDSLGEWPNKRNTGHANMRMWVWFPRTDIKPYVIAHIRNPSASQVRQEVRDRATGTWHLRLQFALTDSGGLGPSDLTHKTSHDPGGHLECQGGSGLYT